MSRLGSLAAPLVRGCCAPRARSFARALRDPAAAQRRALARIVKACARTDYGRSLGLAPDSGVAAFRARVPVVDYAAIESWIQRQRKDGGEVISPGRTRCYEPTSGSSGAAKHVPYNGALLRSFRSLFAIWAHDLLTFVLRPRSGRTFMSISPRLGAHGGFADDREYLGGALRALIGRFLVMPPGLQRVQDAQEFRDRLACALVSCADLEVVSVWNPSYLLILLEHYESHQERLLAGLPRARRAALERGPLVWREVWPNLQLVSCWTGAAAAAPARRLAALFPHARLQGKGLLATEAPVTVPLAAAGGCLPLVDEVFIELDDGSGRLRLLEEAESGAEYSVVITTAGGLLRYRLGDRVKVPGWYRGAPLMEFAGRTDAVSDLVGEKVSEAFVARALQAVAAADAFCLLVPVLPERGRPHYRLLTDDLRPALAQALEEAMSAAFRYREARLLGQLDALRVTARPDMRRAVHDAIAASGIKAGDIKDGALIPSLELARRVQAHVVTGSGAPE